MAETADQGARPAAEREEVVPPITNIGRDIARWVSELQGWKREVADACARGVPSTADVAVLFERFLEEHGLTVATAKTTAPPTAPTHDAAAPVAEPAQSVYRVKTIEHVSGVNKLPTSTSIDVGAGTNLTIVYGPNAAGKSGYFRILKASCFTRTAGGREVLSDVWAPAPVAQKAVITVTQDGKRDLALKWEGGAHDAVLHERVAVFDSTSVRAHLDEKNSLVFTPAGLDLFSRMASVYAELKARLDQEVKQRAPSLKVALEGNSRVTELLATLGPTSPLEELKQLAAFSDVETRELDEAERQLHELVRVDPTEVRARAETKLKRLATLKDALDSAPAALSDASMARLRAAREALSVLERQAEIASTAQFSTEPVQPVGTRAWLDLIAAATRYATEAYPATEYPTGNEGECCVLCQQPLDTDAVDRMKRFWAVTDTRVRQEIAQAKRGVQQLADEISRVNLAPLAPESSSIAALDSAGDLAARVATVYEALRKRRDAAVEAHADKMVAAPPTAPIIEDVSRLMQRTSTELERHNANAGDRARTVAALRERATVLQHRRSLAQVIADVVHAVQDHRWIAAATKAASSLKTNELSAKQRGLVEQLLKSDYAARLADECKDLGFALPVEIHLAGVSGQTVRTVHLTGAGARVSPTQILSEGEQRALALADFLTEATVASEFDCLVFDDPVTSHDHQRKHRVADRLVRESKERQVIIFTHDRVFIALLLAAVKVHGTTVTCRTIGRRPADDAPGFPQVTVFPEPTYEEQAITDAERLLHEAKQAQGTELRDKVLLGFGRLRTAYEEFIQHQFFGGVVNRWIEQIRWMHLHKVFFDPDTVRAVQGRLEALSRYIDAHSHSDGFEEAPPTAADLEREVAAFRAMEKDYKAKKKQFTAAASPKEPLL